MKSFLLIIAALSMVTLIGAQPAAALSTDHDSAYANASGGSRFSDPDDALGGDDTSGSNQFGMVQLGNSSSDGSSGITFGTFMMNDSQGNLTMPGYAMQGCLSAVCQH